MSIQEYPIESNEFLAVTPLLSGQAHLTGVQFAVVLDQQRPAAGDFTDATIVGGITGIMTGGRAAKGTYHVWYTITDVAPETPWFDCGPTFRLT